MKANELMVDDWVYIKDYPMIKSPQRIRPEHFVRSLVDFEPIPLTPEILEKNGFKADEADEIFTYQDGYEIRVSFVDGNKELGLEPYIYLNIEFAEKLLSKEIEYVHELQQAMRIMGCDKEIEL